jgi:hypothetical protein
MMTGAGRRSEYVQRRWEDLLVSGAMFEIVINGTISEPVVALIDGFQISRIEHGLTHLTGSVPDQAKLQGILKIFGNLNIELVSVNPLEEEERTT